MHYFPSVTTSFDDLASNPIRWALSRLAVYLSVAAVAGVTFMVGATIYAYIWPHQTPATVPPVETIVAPPDVTPPSTQPKDFQYPELKPSLNEALIAKYMGAPIISDGIQIGIVDGVLFGPDSKPVSVVVGRTDGVQPQRVVVPYDKVGWKTEKMEPTERFQPASFDAIAGIVDASTIAASEPVQNR
jgi:hypothetical protein